MRFKIFGTCVSAVLLLTASALHAETANFEGEKITLIVPYKTGGGATVYTRYLAPLLEKHLPGNPSTIVKNIPGGSSLKALNWFARTATDDGKLVSNTGPAFFIKSLIGEPAVKYNTADFTPLIASRNGWLVYLRPELGEKTGGFDKVKGKVLRYGGRSPTTGEMLVLIGFEMLGVELKPIWGLSSGKRRQAFMRNEIDIGQDTMSSYHKHVVALIEEGQAVPWFTVGYIDDKGAVVRDPMLPDIPSFKEMYVTVHGKEPSGMAWEAYKAVLNIRVMSIRTLIIPRKTKPEILQAYRDAMEKVVSDPAVTGEKGKRVLGPYPHSIGAKAEQVMKAATEMDPDVTAWLKKWLRDKYGVGKS